MTCLGPTFNLPFLSSVNVAIGPQMSLTIKVGQVRGAVLGSPLAYSLKFQVPPSEADCC